MTREIRTDPHLGTVVNLVASRQSRPNLPTTGCPFCPGGVEAPEPYDVRAFANRWPALNDGACEVILYTPDHDATFQSLGVAGARRVIDLWATRTSALHERPDGEYVLVFENRGAEVGATIAHPHGQMYAFDHVPARPATLLRAGWEPEQNPGDRLVRDEHGWRVWTRFAPVHPVSLCVAPTSCVADLPSMDDATRDGLARVLVDLFAGLDALYGTALPYMMWINQAPRTAEAWPAAWCNLEIVSPWRAANLPRYIAAAEVATEEYFNPVDPAWVARTLRGE